MRRLIEGALAGVFLLVLTCSIASADYLEPNVNYAPNRIIIAIHQQYAPISYSIISGRVITGLPEIDALNNQFQVSHIWQLFPGAETKGEPAMAGYYSITFRSGENLETVLSAYDNLQAIEHVEPIGIHQIVFIPNDPSRNNQWALSRIDAYQAWDVTQGDPTVPLAIADTGVDWDHPDLNNDIWNNTEDPIDGSDNDGNGYIDDFRGWDWVDGVSGYPGEDDNNEDNNPMDFFGHGTHCSGIAAAETNNGVGVCGIGFDCTIMALRIGWQATDGNGYVDMSFAASAFYYAGNNGARAVNCSWGSSNSGGISSAATYASNHSVQIVSAAGNEDNTVAPYLCTRGDVIAVAATDNTDHKADFSSYGSWVDVSAPGVNIYSTYFNNTYAWLDGTSMAAPHVVGIIGLIRSVAPSLTRSQVQQQVINTTEDIDGLNPGYENLLGSGRVNAFNAVDGLGSAPDVPIPYYPIGNIYVGTPRPTFYWNNTPNADVFNLQVDQNSAFSSPDIDNSSITDSSFTATLDLADGLWYWRVRAGNGGAWSAFTAGQIFRIDSQAPNTTTLLTPLENSWTSDRTPYFSWQAVSDPGGSGVAMYYIQVDRDPAFNPPNDINDSTNMLNFTPISNLIPDNRFNWRIRARDDAGNFGQYAAGTFGVDFSAPPAPINFTATPDGWSLNPTFTLNWTNPPDSSGIEMALYKFNSPPTSNFDTTGHLSGTPPTQLTLGSSGMVPIYIWLKDFAGNTVYLNNRADTLRYDGDLPTGSMANSPDSTAGPTFPVSWSEGSDLGSGLSGMYDIYYKDGVGAWSLWLNDYFGLSEIFSGAHGHTYYFEASGIDVAGNNELVTGIAETETVVDSSFQGPAFVAGDVNASGSVNGLDVTYLINYLKGGPAPPDPILRADANGTCSVNGLDVSYLVNYLKGGPAPFPGNCLTNR